MPQNNLTRKRKPRIPKNNPLNPNYEKLRARIIAKRERRQQKRIAQGKAPIAHPLTMVNGVEQRRAHGRGNLLLLDGQTRVSVPLVRVLNGEKAFLQGVYKLPNGEFAVLRSIPFVGVPALKYFIRANGGERSVESFFCRINDIGHVWLNGEGLRGMGLGIRAAAKAEKEYRAIGGEQPVWVGEKLKQVYEKLPYKQTGKMPQNMVKKTKAFTRDDMQKNHVIEAIDPVTGKQKTFTFHIKNGGV